MIEFQGVDQALAAYESAEYQEVLAIVRDTAKREVRIVPGASQAP